MNWDIHHIKDGRRLQRKIFNRKIVVVPIESTEDELAYEVVAPKMKEGDGMEDDSGAAFEEEDEANDHIYVSDAHDDNTDMSHSPHVNVRSPHANRPNTPRITLRDLREITLGGFASIHNKLNDIIERLDRHLVTPVVHHITIIEKPLHPTKEENIVTNHQSNVLPVGAITRIFK